MSISIVLNTHKGSDITNDTIDSIKSYLTNDIIVITDAKNKELDLDVPLIQGFSVSLKTLYKNVALGLDTLYKIYPDSDWYGYLDYDCLVTSDYILSTLDKAAEQGIWLLGCDGTVDFEPLPLIEEIIGAKLENRYKMLGCCLFFHKDFMKQLHSINFFTKLLEKTNLVEGVIGFKGHDISEHIYPTLVRYYGKQLGVMTSWFENEWHGNYKRFPIRFRPVLTEEDNFPESSICHPIKEYDDVIRIARRKERCLKTQKS